jgi:hypothetical protein
VDQTCQARIPTAGLDPAVIQQLRGKGKKLDLYQLHLGGARELLEVLHSCCRDALHRAAAQERKARKHKYDLPQAQVRGVGLNV